jgi:hypothetical protein
MEEWMRVFAYHRILGNWDSYTFSVGQNMFAYKVAGERWVLMPWDIDFVLGLGNGASDPLTSGGQDPVANKMYNDPTFRRALWRPLTRLTVRCCLRITRRKSPPAAMRCFKTASPD